MVPSVFMVFCYIRIIRMARRTSKTVKPLNYNQSSNDRKIYKSRENPTFLNLGLYYIPIIVPIAFSCTTVHHTSDSTKITSQTENYKNYISYGKNRKNIQEIQLTEGKYIEQNNRQYNENDLQQKHDNFSKDKNIKYTHKSSNTLQVSNIQKDTKADFSRTDFTTKNLKKKRKNPEIKTRTESQKASLRTVLSLLVVVISFFICMTPFCVTKLIKVLHLHGRGVPDYVNLMAAFFGYMSSVVNPLLYAILRKDYRCAYRKLLIKIGCYKAVN